MDEVHYLADRFRGAVWEEVIIHLPDDVLLVSLSATVSNAEEFGAWLDTVRGDTEVVVSEHRPVPLWQHVLLGPPAVRPVRGGHPATCRSRKRASRSRSPRPAPGGPRGRPGRRQLGRGPVAARPAALPRGAARARCPAVPTSRSALDAAGLLPAIDLHLQPGRLRRGRPQCLAAGRAADHPGREREQIRRIVDARCADIPDEDLACSATGSGPRRWSAGSPRTTPGCCRRSRRWSRSCSPPAW